ncbi:hypothetical protein JTB14_019560 [Gonioctena quinquepunctata]|nr:hypothetical protein JTB14_019560 [Gonioctena quinquepunctata]
MESRSRKNSSEDELHTQIKSLVTTLCTSDEFIDRLSKTITQSISKKYKEDIQKLEDENKRVMKKLEEQDKVIESLVRQKERQDETFRSRNIIVYGNEGIRWRKL